MKTSLRRLRGLRLHRQDGADDQRRDLRSHSQLDELEQASQDLEDMRNCYDSLLAAAAATTNTVYEFSESLGEYGSCLLEKTAMNDDEESGKVLLMLGKLQFELQKVLDSYRSHLSRTITVPSQSLLNELRTVEEMKQLSDEKRSVYEDLITKQKEKGRRTVKGERFSMQQLQEAREQYEEEATLFIFRLKSLKQGQSRSLLTQAARHHVAQRHLFRKALKAIDAVEPHVKFVAEQQHIDYQLNGLEDDDSYVVDDYDDDEDDDEDDSYDMNYDGELSFEYRQNNASSTFRHSMELVDRVELTLPKVAALDTLKKNSNRVYGAGESFASKSGNIKSYTQSAPLFADKKSDLSLSGMVTAPMRQLSTRKLQTYVLPTPGDRPPKTTNSVSSTKVAPLPSSVSNPSFQKLWHSSPLGPPKKQHTETSSSTLLPPPRGGAEGLLFSQFDPLSTSSSKKIKRQAFSGPLMNNKQQSMSNPLTRPERSNLYSGPLLRNPLSQPLSSPPPIVSRASSPPLAPSPKINELHELPRPPPAISSRPSGFVGYSAPLGLARGRDPSGRNEPGTASPLPRPPEALTRSISIPSSASTLMLSKASKSSEEEEMDGEVMSPPLTPLSFSNVRIIPADSSRWSTKA